MFVLCSSSLSSSPTNKEVTALSNAARARVVCYFGWISSLKKKDLLDERSSFLTVLDTTVNPKNPKYSRSSIININHSYGIKETSASQLRMPLVSRSFESFACRWCHDFACCWCHEVLKVFVDFTRSTTYKVLL